MTKTTYNAPTMRLSGMNHTGGVLTVTEQDDGKVILEMAQEVKGTHGTEWRIDKHIHPAQVWAIVKDFVLKNCTPAPTEQPLFKVGGGGRAMPYQEALEVANGIYRQTGAFLSIERAS